MGNSPSNQIIELSIESTSSIQDLDPLGPTSSLSFSSFISFFSLYLYFFSIFSNFLPPLTFAAGEAARLQRIQFDSPKVHHLTLVFSSQDLNPTIESVTYLIAAPIWQTCPLWKEGRKESLFESAYAMRSRESQVHHMVLQN